MSLGTILLIVVVLMLLDTVPTWPHSKTWGYSPVGGLGVLLVVAVLLMMLGRL